MLLKDPSTVKETTVVQLFCTNWVCGTVF